MIEANTVKEFKPVSKEIIKELKQCLDKNTRDSEYNPCDRDISFTFDNKVYGLIEHYEGEWADEGKYQYQTLEYQLVEFDNSEYEFPYSSNIINRFNLFVELSVSRSGSYYSDYCYDYEISNYFEYDLVTVPEVIIHEHEEAVQRNIN